MNWIIEAKQRLLKLAIFSELHPASASAPPPRRVELQIRRSILKKLSSRIVKERSLYS